MNRASEDRTRAVFPERYATLEISFDKPYLVAGKPTAGMHDEEHGAMDWQRCIMTGVLLAALAASDFTWAVPPVSVNPDETGQLVVDGSGPSPLLKWTALLSSQRFADRQNATRNLLRARQEAIPFLKEAATSRHSETIWRAVTILEQMACDVHDVQLRMAALETLRTLEGEPDPRTHRRSAVAVKHHAQWRQGHALLMMSRWGGDVRSYRRGDQETLRVRLDKKWTGGDAGLAELLFVGPVTWMSMETAPITDAGLQSIQSLVGLERLYLGQTRITGEGLSCLKNLKTLRHLSLRYLDIQDRTLRQLVHLQQLNSLGLDDTPITDAGLRYLQHVPHLQSLWLDRTRITSGGLVHLRPLQELSRLYLVNTRVTGKGLAELRHLPKLKYLTLKGVVLTDVGFAELSQLGQLETLGLDATAITDRQLKHLLGLKNIQTLWLSHSKITETGLKQLQSLAQLKRLYVQGLDVSDETADWFKKTLPECRLYR